MELFVFNGFQFNTKTYIEQRRLHVKISARELHSEAVSSKSISYALFFVRFFGAAGSGPFASPPLGYLQ